MRGSTPRRRAKSRNPATPHPLKGMSYPARAGAHPNQNTRSTEWSPSLPHPHRPATAANPSSTSTSTATATRAASTADEARRQPQDEQHEPPPLLGVRCPDFGLTLPATPRTQRLHPSMASATRGGSRPRRPPLPMRQAGNTRRPPRAARARWKRPPGQPRRRVRPMQLEKGRTMRRGGVKSFTIACRTPRHRSAGDGAESGAGGPHGW